MEGLVVFIFAIGLFSLMVYAIISYVKGRRKASPVDRALEESQVQLLAKRNQPPGVKILFFLWGILVFFLYFTDARENFPILEELSGLPLLLGFLLIIYFSRYKFRKGA